MNAIYTVAKRSLITTQACLSINRKNRLVNGGTKGDASISKTQLENSVELAFDFQVHSQGLCRAIQAERPRTGGNKQMESIFMSWVFHRIW